MTRSTTMNELRAAIHEARAPSGNVDEARRRMLGALPPGLIRTRLNDCKSRDEKNSRQWCRMVICPTCAERRANARFDQMWASLKDVPPDRLRWITVILSATTEPDLDAKDARGLHHRRLVKVIQGLSAGAHPVVVWGAREVALVRPADFPNLSEGKRRLLHQVGYPSNATGPVFVFHLHMVVDLAGADVGQLDRLFRAEWPGERRVKIEPMFKNRTHEANIRTLAFYMSKVELMLEVDEEDTKEWLSDDEIRALVGWRMTVAAQWSRFDLGTRVHAVTRPRVNRNGRGRYSPRSLRP